MAGKMQMGNAGVHAAYDISPGDERFVMVRGVSTAIEGQESARLIFVENFFEELKAKVGN